jgi:hypothetical protein
MLKKINQAGLSKQFGIYLFELFGYDKICSKQKKISCACLKTIRFPEQEAVRLDDFPEGVEWSTDDRPDHDMGVGKDVG